MKKFLEICGGIDVGKREIAVTILKGPTTAEQAFLNHLAQVIVEPVSIQGLANVEEAVDCLGSSIGFAMADKANVPKPARLKRGQKLAPVPLWIVGKLALYWAVRDSGISQSELARRLNIRETVVRRMLDPNHDTRPEKSQAALEVLGKRVVMAYDDAA